ncbi:MAG: hypothetical protein IPJ13_14345 [Saprospiraceae bacterium]|nr:hypothetical protein [Saprospiraceae bacterium]
MQKDIISIARQYEICSIARKMLTGDLPVEGDSPTIYWQFRRIYENKSRKDFAILPPDNLLTAVEREVKQSWVLVKFLIFCW